nr:hypothetical protein [Clostridia bacterium]
MIILLIGLLSLYALFMPVTFRIEVHHAGKTAYRVIMKYTFVTKTWQSGPQKSSKPRRKENRSLLSILRQEAKARIFIRRHIRLDRLDSLIILHAGDAARTSLLSGGLQGLANILSLQRQEVRIHVIPDFFRGYTTVQTLCIIHVRLGIILLTMLMLLASRLQRKARTAYGTSHW